MDITSEMLSDDIKQMIDDEIINVQYNLSTDGKYQIAVYSWYLFGDAYEEILKRAGISEIKENEIVISQSKYLKGSKYSSLIKVTNYKVRRYNYN